VGIGRDTGVTIAKKITGTRFEALVKERCVQLHILGLAHITRYGVQAVRSSDTWHVIPSLPDYEGVTREGRQTIFDAKVCSQASFALDKYRLETKGSRSRQLKHMLDRSQFGVRCFFLLHWNERQLTNRTIQAETYAFPISIHHRFWDSFLAGEVKAIRRQDCETYGHKIRWTLATSSDRKPRPDVLAAVLELKYSAEIAG